MSIKIMSQVMRDQAYDGKQKLILLAIADAVDNNGVGFASYRQIRQVTDVSDEYLRRCIREFIDAGRLQVVRKGSGPGKATVYRVLLPNSVEGNSVAEYDELPNSEASNSPTQLDRTPQLQGPNSPTASPNPPSYTPLETPSLEAPGNEVSQCAPPSANVIAQQITRAYTNRVPLSKFVAIMGIVKKALKAGYAPERIEAALIDLADEGRPVTIDTLRIQLEGIAPTPSRRDQRLNQTMAWAAEQDALDAMQEVEA